MADDLGDFEADLLALAGEDAPQDSDTKAQAVAPRSPSPSTARPNSHRQQSPPKPQKGVARKATKSSRASVPKSRSKLESGDEESDAASSPDSLGSGAMSESDSDAGLGSPTADDEQDGARYPIDGKFLSLKDKEEILSMPEARREQILSERMEEVERDNFNRQLRQRREAQQKEAARAAEKKKRKATVAELDDSPRKVNKKQLKQNENLEAYKRQREQRNEQRQRDSDRQSRDKKSPSHRDGFSDAEGDEESDVEWAEEPARKEQPPPDIRDFERCRVGRSNFARVCFTPGFDDAIKGCFARVSIGQSSQGQNVYRMTQIKAFTTGRPYTMETSSGNTFQTDQYAVVAHGKAEKTMPFIACSDSRFTPEEFARYNETQKADSLRIPTHPFLNAKLDAIHALLNHQWTDAEISEKLRRSGIMQAKYREIDRVRLGNERSTAVARNDTAALERIDAELAALEGPRAQNGAHTAADPARAPTQQERLAALNAANRRANAEQIRRAQLADKARDRANQAAVARGEAVANPFARVKTRAKVHHDANEGGLAVPKRDFDDLFGDESGASRAATPVPNGKSANGTPRKGTPQPGGASAPKTLGKKKLMDDEIMGAIDLGIDIDI